MVAVEGTSICIDSGAVKCFRMSRQSGWKEEDMVGKLKREKETPGKGVWIGFCVWEEKEAGSPS